MGTCPDLPDGCLALLVNGYSLTVGPIDLGRPAVLTGCPDEWEPEEPRDFGDVFHLQGGRWLPMQQDQIEELAQDIWKAIDREITASDYEDEIND